MARKLTNVTGLPEAVYNAIANDSYSRGNSDISVTSLIGPPRQFVLKERHKDEIVEDAADLIWSLQGRLMHELLEKATGTALKEQTLYATIGGWVVKGQMDELVVSLAKDGRGNPIDALDINDYKYTTVYSMLGREVKPEWVQQQNCYAHILRLNDFPVNSLSITAIYRDWKKNEARRSPDYPRKPAEVIRLPLWSHDDAQAYMEHRVALHRAALVDLPECSPEDRWAKPTKYAVMKKGRKSALRLLDSPERALEWAHSNGHTLGCGKLAAGVSVVKRPGVSTRCLDYCIISDKCSQWAELQKLEADDAEA